MVCSTAAKTETTLGDTKREFYTLQDRCRMVILKHTEDKRNISFLCLPQVLKQYLIEN